MPIPRVRPRVCPYRVCPTNFLFPRSSPTGKSAQTYRRRNSSDVYEDFSSSLQNPTEWQDVLKSHRRRSTQFTDPDFPPSQASIGGGNLKVSGWSRISDIYGPTSLLVELSFFDDETMSMCGASPALTQAEFDSLPRESAPNHAEKAKKILTVALTSDDLSQLNLDDRMSSWLSSFASNHNDGLEVDRIDVKPVFSHKKGYVSTVRCYCRVQFKSFDIGMFQRGADGTFVDPADVCQGALGDCYFVGAMSTLGMQVRRRWGEEGASKLLIVRFIARYCPTNPRRSPPAPLSCRPCDLCAPLPCAPLPPPSRSSNTRFARLSAGGGHSRRLPRSPRRPFGPRATQLPRKRAGLQLGGRLCGAILARRKVQSCDDRRLHPLQRERQTRLRE